MIRSAFQRRLFWHHCSYTTKVRKQYDCQRFHVNFAKMSLRSSSRTVTNTNTLFWLVTAMLRQLHEPREPRRQVQMWPDGNWYPTSHLATLSLRSSKLDDNSKMWRTKITTCIAFSLRSYYARTATKVSSFNVVEDCIVLRLPITRATTLITTALRPNNSVKFYQVHSTSSLCPCHDLTATNTFTLKSSLRLTITTLRSELLIPYHDQTTTNAFRLLFLRPARSHCRVYLKHGEVVTRKLPVTSASRLKCACVTFSTTSWPHILRP